MQDHERTIRPALAVVVVICFFLPFVQLTCGGQQIASLSGWDLATGTTVKPPDMDNMFESFPGAEQYKADPAATTQTDNWNTDESATPQDPTAAEDPTGEMSMEGGELEAEPTASVALILAGIALIASFAAKRRAMFIGAIASGLCAVLLFILKSNGMGDMPPEAMGIISIKWTMAFWVATFGSAALAVVTFRTLNQQEPPVSEKPRLVIQPYQEKQPTHQP